MLNPTPIEVLKQRTKTDCGVCCLAMWCGVSYETALETIALGGTSARRGLYQTNLITASAALGKPLRKVRKYKLEEAGGILTVENDKTRHFVLLREGAIIDPFDGTLWNDIETYLASHKFKAMTLLSPVSA